MKRISIISLLLGMCSFAFIAAAPPEGYYNQASGKKNSGLKTAMHNVIRVHKYLDFSLYTPAYYWWDNYYTKTDWHPNGYYWDMYSNDKYSTYRGGNFQNREHCMPRSWWGVSGDYDFYDSNGDLHNIYPANQPANEAKLNYPLGEVGIIDFNNGVVKVGRNTISAYSGTVFEPADEYKGDFARTFFYMVTCYEDYYSNWRSLGLSMMRKETYPVFQTWAINMLLEWSRNDPVSEKEINRNEAVYKIQNNRNPFIDFPDLAEYIWGNKINEEFVIDGVDPSDPILTTPINGSIIDFGEVLVNGTKVMPVLIKGNNLTGNMSVRIFSDNNGVYSLPITSIPSSLINSENGYILNITYRPKSESENTATLVLLDAGIDGSIGVTLQGKGSYNPNGIEENVDNSKQRVYTQADEIIFQNIQFGSVIEIYSIDGEVICKFKLEENNIKLNRTGVFIVKVNNKAFKIIL